MKKKLLATLLVLVMVLSILPLQTLAEGATTPTVTINVTVKERGTENCLQGVPVTVACQNATNIGFKKETKTSDYEGKLQVVMEITSDIAVINQFECYTADAVGTGYYLDTGTPGDLRIYTGGENSGFNKQDIETVIHEAHITETDKNAIINFTLYVSGYDDTKWTYKWQKDTLEGEHEELLTIEAIKGRTDFTEFPDLPKDPNKGSYYEEWLKEDFNDQKTTVFTAVVRNKVTVYFNPNIEGESEQLTYVIPGDKISKPEDPSKEGHTFLGWYVTAVGEETLDEDAQHLYFKEPYDVEETMTLTAKWEPKEYDITYKDGADGEVFETKTVPGTYGEDLPIPFEEEPKRSGYAFDYWYEEGTNGNEAYGESMVRGNVTLVAKWTPTYTVTYTDGVEGEEIFEDQTHTLREGAETPAFDGTPTREGYTFEGWDKTIADTVTADVTYTAQWKVKETVVPPTTAATEPSTEPSTAPTTEPTTAPTTEPTAAPTTEPTTAPTTATTTTTPTNTPKTGDTTPVIVLFAMMILSGAGLMVVGLLNKKHQYR